jgi:Skp family chaperone for outer membrane proteins
MKTSKLVNDYVKAHEAHDTVNKEIQAQTEALQNKLKALKKKKETLKNAIMEELEASNSKRLESKTNFVVWQASDIPAHVRNNILVNKEPKPIIFKRSL